MPSTAHTRRAPGTLEPPPPSSRSSAALRALLRPAVGPGVDPPEALPGFSALELDFFRRGEELDAPPVAA
jgi:hypothetical protein